LRSVLSAQLMIERNDSAQYPYFVYYPESYQIINLCLD
jgi:hypothetical protein